MPTPRDLLRLAGVHPTLIAAIVRILTDMPALFVVMGVRTAEEQHVLWLKRPKVTEKDGYILKSNHQAHADGLGRAVDCAFLGPDPFASTHPWDVYGAKVEAAGLIWGGRWKGLVDRPHAELPVGTSLAV